MNTAEKYTYIGKILEKIHPGVTIADKEGNFVYIGSACSEFFGEQVKDFLGVNVTSGEVARVFNPCVTEMVLRQQTKITSTQKNSNGDTTFVTGIPVFDSMGELELIICFSSWDIANYEDLKIHFRQLKAENEDLQRQLERITREERLQNHIISESHNVQTAVRLLKIFSQQRLPAFIYGPTGCGKTYLVKATYGQEGRVIEYNCDLVPQQNLETDLLGNENVKGIVYTKGYSCLLLRHIELISPMLQKRLIEAVKQSKIMLVATSTYSLEQLKEQKLITRELYYFFKSYQVELQGLNERPEDLQQFLKYYINKFNSRYGRNISFSPRAINCLLSCPWQDNIVEVRYRVERLILTAKKNEIDIYHLPKELTGYSEELFAEGSSLKDMVELYEKGIICRAYEKYHTTVNLAKHLNISQATAVRKIDKYVDKKLSKGGFAGEKL